MARLCPPSSRFPPATSETPETAWPFDPGLVRHLRGWFELSFLFAAWGPGSPSNVAAFWWAVQDLNL